MIDFLIVVLSMFFAYQLCRKIGITAPGKNLEKILVLIAWFMGATVVFSLCLFLFLKVAVYLLWIAVIVAVYLLARHIYRYYKGPGNHKKEEWIH